MNYNAKNLIDVYGKIIRSSIEIIGYSKYTFTLLVNTDKDKRLELIVGGGSNDIYYYNPYGDWDEHINAGIVSISDDTK